MTRHPSDQAGPELPKTSFVVLSASGSRTVALERLIPHLVRQEGVAVIIVLQKREALDGEPLRRVTAAAGGRFAAVVNGERVEGGRIYLPEPGVLVEIHGGRFRLRLSDEESGRRGTIDTLLVSLARDQAGRVLAVALAGTDGDGTLGFKTIKETDNLALAEETEEVRSGDLGGSESPAALADAVLPLDALTERVLSCLHHLAQRTAALEPEPSLLEQTAALASIIRILHERTGHDFHGYKQGTFLRRVQRRMQVAETTDMDAYVVLLRDTPDEVLKLFNDLLIGVTRFFRDTVEFQRLEQHVVPGLFAGKGREDQVRVWVIGCSTGEEAYSIGILLREYMAEREGMPQVQIFATDLDGRALAAARVGRYPESIADDLSPEQLARWFIREGNTYCVVRELREMCIFSEHSVLKDAPFSRLDLVSCRNLLIYIDQELQERILPLFHFALRPGGVLFLGSSENASRHADLFAPIANNSRIFRRIDTGNRTLPDLPFLVRPMNLAATSLPPTRIGENALARGAQRFAERYAPAFIIVDVDLTVLHFSGRVGRFIDPARGAASLNVLQLLHPDLRLDLRMALTQVAESGQTLHLDGLRIGQNGDRLVVDVVVEPNKDGTGTLRAFFVLFQDVAARNVPASDDFSLQQNRTEHLEMELRSAQERIQAANEELESTNEELKASNEEYQTLNEELQSMNEELQTSKEELQSVNEELTTLNGELGHRVRSLNRANTDLKNLLESTQIASVFLDHDLRITNFTPAAGDLFHLVASDAGRPIAHIKARVTYDDLQDDAKRVLRTLNTQEREIEDRRTGACYMVRVLPYRSSDNYISGVVVTFIDITELRRRADLVRDREERYRALEIATSSTTYRMSADWSEMYQLDGNGVLTDTRQTSAVWLSEYIPVEERPLVLMAIADALREKRIFELKHRVHRADGSIGWVLSRAVPLLDARGAIREWIGVASDVTGVHEDAEAE